MIKAIFLIFGFLFSLTMVNAVAFSPVQSSIPSPVVTSISSDGHYVITSHCDQRLILWDLVNHTAKLISKKANIYSAYFIKHSHRFMWQQDDNNVVHIDDVSGKGVMAFSVPFPTYGQIITSDLKYYIASDVDWSLFKKDDQDELRIIEKDESGFLGLGKLRNLTLSPDDRYLLTAGDGSDWAKDPRIQGGPAELRDGVVLWDVLTGKPFMKFPGNQCKTYATLSPDGKYVVGGDEDTWSFVWDSHTGRRIFQIGSLFYGYLIRHGECPIPIPNKICYWDKSGWIKPPDDFHTLSGNETEAIISIKFIDQTHYLRFTTMTDYAVLYDVHSPKHLKFLDLGVGIKPFPMNGAYDANTTFDSSPDAHILVIGQAGHAGIIVYQYDPEKQTLTRIWEPTLYSPSPNDNLWDKIVKEFHRWLEE